MKRGGVHSREIKLTVVRQVVGGERQPSQVCREYGISEGPAMREEENKAVVRRLWEEVWNRADLAVADRIFDAAYAAHEKAFVPVVRAAFPDSHHTIEDLIAEGDKVVTRFTRHGTHRGEFMGVPPTGRRVAVGGIWIHRLEAGRIVEGREWGQVDWLGLLQQLGAATGGSASADRSTSD